jgi:flagellar basal-body rod modification protein FlgD
MSVNPITSTTGSGLSTTDSSTGSSTLNQANFLQLLVAQLQNQDPMNPQSDTDMAAQMAQFSSLQQSTNMSGSLSMMQANSLIGSTVNLQIDSHTTTSGTVQGVIMQNGTPEILVDGATYNLNQVLSVEPATGTTSTTGSGSTHGGN